jgi:hypothetical protein
VPLALWQEQVPARAEIGSGRFLCSQLVKPQTEPNRRITMAKKHRVAKATKGKAHVRKVKGRKRPSKKLAIKA